MNRYSEQGKRKSIFTPPSNQTGNYNSTQKQALELEKLEQEITLTLQDIDRNLSKSNKVINDSLIPVIKNYAQSSRNVWNSVSFWKSFFEASANVSLSGYEEAMEPFAESLVAGDQRESNDAEDNTARDESTIHNQSTTDDIQKRYRQDFFEYDGQQKAREEDEPMIEESPIRSESFENSPARSDALSQKPRRRMLSSTPNVKRTKPFLDDTTRPATENFIDKLRDDSDSIQRPPVSGAGKESPSASPPKNPTITMKQGGPIPNLTSSSIFENFRNDRINREQTKVMHQALDNNWKLQLTPKSQRYQNNYTREVEHNLEQPETSPRRSSKRHHRESGKRSSVAQQFDSSPYGLLEPPRLQSELEASPSRSKKAVESSPTHENQMEDTTKQQRFPETPKYGAGGSLLRTKNGTSAALLYSRERPPQPEFRIGLNESLNNDSTQQTPPVLSKFAPNNAVNVTNTTADDDSLKLRGMSPPVTINFAMPNKEGAADNDLERSKEGKSSLQAAGDEFDRIIDENRKKR